VAAKKGEARANLKTALAVYQSASDGIHVLESSLVEARAAESFLRTDADVGNDKFVKALASARDVTAAAEIRLERGAPVLAQASQTLQKAVAAARAEFAFLHFEARQERLNHALDEFNSLFDKEIFSRRLRITFLSLAETTSAVAELDRVIPYADHRHLWARLDHPVPSSKQLLQAATEIEDRFTALDRVTSPK
jgi:hypothetical protein